MRLRALTQEQVFWVASPVALLALWEFVSRFGILDVRIFPPPTSVAVTMWNLIAQGVLLSNSAVTALRFLVGFFLGTIPGMFLGLTMGLFPTIRAILNPLVSAIYPLPRIALFPLVLIVLGLNEQSNIVMIAVGPFFSMLLSAQAAVLNIEPIYLDVAKSFKCGKKDLYQYIVIPAALPVVFGGIKISLGLALLGTVAAEFLVADNGLGYMIWHSWQLLALDLSMAGLVATGLIGFVIFIIADQIEKWLIPWK